MNTPNILFITDDQHRWDFYDNRTVPSLNVPTLTRLQQQGTIFTHAYSNCPMCMPTRMTWVHALYASQVADGLMHNWHKWPTRLASMPAALQNHGYTTAMIGKLHAQGKWHNDLTHFEEEARGRGFDYVWEVCGKSFAEHVDCHWTHYLQSKGLLERYREDLKRRVESSGGTEPSDPSFLKTEDHMDSFIGRRVCAWLDSYSGQQPFYLHASFCGPHFPIDPPEEYACRYSADDIPDPVGVKDPEKIRYWKKRTAAYCAMIEHVDTEIGRVLETLERRGMARDTLVIFGTDHGDMMGHHDRAHKGWAYDTSCRTPYILHWPGKIPAGVVRNDMIEAVDLPITVLEAAGVKESPQKLLPSTPGRSFLKAALGNGDGPRQWVYSEVGSTMAGWLGDQNGWRMVREQDYKYVNMPGGRELLFDMAADPWETRNRATDPDLQPQLQRMRLELIDSLRQCITPSQWRIGE
jgi:arylsulfatase A-like enzyme